MTSPCSSVQCTSGLWLWLDLRWDQPCTSESCAHNGQGLAAVRAQPEQRGGMAHACLLLHAWSRETKTGLRCPTCATSRPCMWLSHGTLRQVLQSGTDDQALQPAATVYFALYLVQRGRFLEATLALKAVAELQGTFSSSPVPRRFGAKAHHDLWWVRVKAAASTKAPSCMCEASAGSLQAPSTASRPLGGGPSQRSN